MAEKKLIPELRFPGFEGEWEEKKLSEFADIGRGKSKHRPRNASILYKNGKYPFVQTGDIKDAYLYLTKFNQRYSEFGLKQSKLWPSGTLCVTIAANIAETAILGIDACFPDSIIGIVPLDNKADVVFLKYQFDKLKNEIQRLSEGVAQDNLNLDKLSKISFILPDIEEQKILESFLSALDNRIQLLENKKKTLNRYRNEVMQRIFSQVIRFKDSNGMDFPDWEEKSFGDLYTFKSTNSLSRDKLNYKSGKIKNIHYGDIHTKFPSHLDVSKTDVPFVNAGVNSKNISADSFVKEGDLIIADASEDYADIGKALEVVMTNNEKVLSGLHTILARRLGNQLEIGFGGHFMKSYAMRLSIMRIAQGTKVLSISSKRLAEIKTPIPSPPEQKKITQILTDIDNLIYKVTQQLNYTAEYKKGLLQKMFV